MKVVEQFTPLKRTISPFAKPTPLTVRVKPEPPALVEEGNKLESTGVIERFTTLEVLPPLTTVIA